MKEQLFITPEYITAKELKQIRKQLGLTQKELAMLIHCSKSTVERWEISEKPITGPVGVLIKMLERYPEYTVNMKVPARSAPLRLWYMHKQTVCTIIDVNEVKQEVTIRNYTDNLMFRAFGAIENPDFKMYKEFLESRCFPESIEKMKLKLKYLDLPFYDPYFIVEKTEGRMAEDDFWIKIER